MNLQTITQRLKLIAFYCIATGISVISLGATYTTNVHALSDMLDASKDSNKTLGINSAANVYNQLESKYISLQKDYEVLEANYNTLENENEKLKEEIYRSKAIEGIAKEIISQTNSSLYGICGAYIAYSTAPIWTSNGIIRTSVKRYTFLKMYT